MMGKCRVSDKGYIQLALRTGVYKYLNCDVLYEGETVDQDKLTGETNIYGEQASETVHGYFAHMTTTGGFRKTIYWTKEKVIAHAKKYSKSWGNAKSAWSTDFDKMALKTLIKELLSMWGAMSVELMNAFDQDDNDMAWDGAAQRDADSNENAEPMDITPDPEDPDSWMQDPDAQPQFKRDF
jgi:recombination protein RecT